MRKFLSVFGIVVGLVLSIPALAGKVDQTKLSVKDKCHKDIPEDQLLEAVVKAFDCQPQQEVTIADCTIKCLKASNGNVIGDK